MWHHRLGGCYKGENNKTKKKKVQGRDAGFVAQEVTVHREQWGLWEVVGGKLGRNWQVIGYGRAEEKGVTRE